MSHFIETTMEYLDDQIIKTRGRQVIVPQVKNFKHCHGECDNNEQNMLKKMFFQLQNEEYQKIHQENQSEIRRQFIKLKSKMNSKNRNISVQKVMDSSLPKLELSDIINMSPLKIDLLKKHRNKIHGKLSIYREAQQIGQHKLKLNEWNNEKQNNPLKSPMFTKMTFLLQKLSTKVKENSYLNLLSRKTVPYKAITRKRNL